MNDLIRTAKFLTIAVTSIAVLAMFSLTEPADARGVRVDSASWDETGPFSADSAHGIGFTIEIFGVTTSTALVSTDGSVTLTDGTNTATLNALFDPDQSGGGNVVQYTVATTNAGFNRAGVEAGITIEWTVLDSGGLLLNDYQLVLFALSDGRFAIEFNYNQILFGDHSTKVGYSSTTGGVFDLAAKLGLSFSQYSGIGDDDISNNCVNTPLAFACNNYDHTSGNFGPSPAVLPDILDNFFRVIDSNGDPVQGRALFLTESDDTGVCGDSELNAGEMCDDGNTTSGDGCDSTCLIEAGFECTLPIPGVPPTPSMCNVVSDSDGDGVTDNNDLCPGTAPGAVVDAFGCSAAQSDSDNDHVADAYDVCPATVIPEAVPTSRRGLGWRRWALDNADGSFTQRRKSRWRHLSFTTADTRGCSCDQIIEASNFGRFKSKINRKYGCSSQVMLHWVNNP